tara:strand:- start:1531 stop:1674 length:144 start_codon:yes stop_codon:yes gene_type:complete
MEKFAWDGFIHPESATKVGFDGVVVRGSLFLERLELLLDMSRLKKND